MSLFSAGQFNLDQAQQGLSSAAQRESSRNIQNKNIAEQESQSKAAIGSTVGGVAGGAIGGATLGSVVPGYGTAIGATIGAIAGAFGAKLF